MIVKYQKCGETYSAVDCSGILDVLFLAAGLLDGLMEFVCDTAYWLVTGQTWEEAECERWLLERWRKHGR